MGAAEGRPGGANAPGRYRQVDPRRRRKRFLKGRGNTEHRSFTGFVPVAGGEKQALGGAKSLRCGLKTPSSWACRRHPLTARAERFVRVAAPDK